MRSPNHVEIKNYCRQAIPELMAKHELGVIKSIHMDTEGWVNPCFFVNDEYVIRFNARDPDLPKYQREKLIFDSLKGSEIPVPPLVILDSDKNAAKYDVLISKKTAGNNLESDWKDLKLKNRSKLANKAGKLLKDIHSREYNFFGEIASSGPLPKTKTWYEYIKAKLNFLIIEARKAQVFCPKTEQLFIDKLSSTKSSIDLVSKASLIHMDFHFGNLIYERDEIVGVVDFEWAIAGDPLYDLMFWRNGNQIFPNSEESFFEGYGKTNFTEDEIQRMALYQMIKNIELSIVAKLHFPSDEALEYRDITLKEFS
jgi:aminoglycoside phosphotransferase (APT) family kinase protein